MSQELQDKALALVAQYSQQKNPEKTIKVHDFSVARFEKTLLNWRAVIYKNIGDGMLYDVVYNGYTAELILTVFVQCEQRFIPDKRN